MISKNIIIEKIGKATTIGLAIVFSINIICMVIAILLEKDTQKSWIIELLTAIFGIIAIFDIGIGLFLKKKLLEPLFNKNQQPDEKMLEQTIMKVTIILSAICAAIPIYGLVIVILGACIEYLAGFTIISLAGFLLLRFRTRDFNKLMSYY